MIWFYSAGYLNCTADCLSRLPLLSPTDIDSDTEPDLDALLSMYLTPVTPKEFESASALHAQIEKGCFSGKCYEH